jgi:hypothetical protein
LVFKLLTAEHIRAIQAFGVSDVGKATKSQNGNGRNSAEVQRLAAEAKEKLGGWGNATLLLAIVTLFAWIASVAARLATHHS